MKRIDTLLAKLKLFDADGTLSLSNIAMAVVIFKLATAGSLDWTVLTAFFLALLNHNARKHWRGKAESKQVKDTERLDQLETTIKSIATASKFNSTMK
jgi:hypothetical protein